MAHKQLEDGRAVVDWTAGDPEGDRIVLLSAYRDFINEILEGARGLLDLEDEHHITKIFQKWSVSTENQVDEVPRIWIKRPEA